MSMSLGMGELGYIGNYYFKLIYIIWIIKIF